MIILENATPRLLEASIEANKTGEPIDVPFIYNEIIPKSEMIPVLEWLYNKGIDFQTKRQEYRFVIAIHPKIKY